jgi:hypothetical protein
MLRLDLSAGPRWVDLGGGVRLEVLPVDTVMMMDIYADLGADEDDAPKHRASFQLAVLTAHKAVLGWEGVGDADGKPLDVTPDGLTALLRIPAMFRQFQAKIVVPAMETMNEGNASAP